MINRICSNHNRFCRGGSRTAPTVIDFTVCLQMGGHLQQLQLLRRLLLVDLLLLASLCFPANALTDAVLAACSSIHKLHDWPVSSSIALPVTEVNGPLAPSTLHQLGRSRLAVRSPGPPHMLPEPCPGSAGLQHIAWQPALQHRQHR